MIKLGRVLFIVEKNGGRRRNREGEEDGRSPGHKLNIVDKFTDELIPLVIISIKITSHHSCHNPIFNLFIFIIIIYWKKKR